MNWVNVQALPTDVRSTDKSVNKNKIVVIKEMSLYLEPLGKTAIYLSLLMQLLYMPLITQKTYLPESTCDYF